MRSAQTFGALTTLLLYNQNLLLPPFQRSIWKTRNACTLTCHFPNMSNSWMANNLVFGKKHETTTFCTTFQASKRVTGSMLHLKAVCWVWKGKAKTMAEESGGNSSTTEDVTQPFPVFFVRVQRWGWIVGMLCESALLHPAVVNSLGPWPFHDFMSTYFLRILAIVWWKPFSIKMTWWMATVDPHMATATSRKIATITNPICLDLEISRMQPFQQNATTGSYPSSKHVPFLASRTRWQRFFFPNLFNSRSCGVGRYGHWKIQAGITWSKGSWLHLRSLGSQFDGLNLECENKTNIC